MLKIMEFYNMRWSYITRNRVILQIIEFLFLIYGINTANNRVQLHVMVILQVKGSYY